MPSKRYRLKLPYVKEGTIVEETEIGAYTGDALVKDEYGNLISMPNCFKQNWLEEMKEEPTCSKEFADALKNSIYMLPTVSKHGEELAINYNRLMDWINQYTSKEE